MVCDDRVLSPARGVPGAINRHEYHSTTTVPGHVILGNHITTSSATPTRSRSAITSQYSPMAETTPLLDDIDDNCAHNGEFEGETYFPATTYFKRFIKILIIITLILSTFTIVLLITNIVRALFSLAGLFERPL